MDIVGTNILRISDLVRNGKRHKSQINLYDHDNLIIYFTCLFTSCPGIFDLFVNNIKVGISDTRHSHEYYICVCNVSLHLPFLCVYACDSIYLIKLQTYDDISIKISISIYTREYFDFIGKI